MKVKGQEVSSNDAPRYNLSEMEQKHRDEDLIVKNKKIKTEQECHKENLILKNKEIEMEQKYSQKI